MPLDLVLRPRDGLTLKDPRGFDRAGGVTAGGLPWPGPATIAGAARAVVGRQLGLPPAYGEAADQWAALLHSIRVAGPIVLTRPVGGPTWAPLWPAPLDALRLPHRQAGQRSAPVARLEWLEPKPRDSSRARARAAWGDDPIEVQAMESLWLPYRKQLDKPLPGRPLWGKDAMIDWLLGPRTRDEHRTPQPCERLDIHVAIEQETLAAKDGALFAHPTYEPLVRSGRGAPLHELALGLRLHGVDDGTDPTKPLWRIGGEGRFASAEPLSDEVLAAPKGLLRNWDDSRFLRLLLVTPAEFAAGWRPDWLEPSDAEGGPRFEGRIPGLEHNVILRAAMIDRADWSSGWDLRAQRPKPSKACVGAGTVYFFESTDRPFTADDIRGLWLSSLQAEQDQARRDGCGLVLPGIWPVAG